MRPSRLSTTLAPVQAQHHVVALPVGEVDHVVVHQHAVGGEGEAEVLALFLLDGPGVGHQALHHVEVHQRLAAEEVHLQVAPGAGIFDQEIQRPLAHLEAHHGPLAVILALAGEAVGAVQVAGVGHVQAQGLHHAAGALLQLPGQGLEGVRREQLPGLLQGRDLVVALGKLLRGHVGIPLRHLRKEFLPAVALVQADDVIGGVVHHVHRAGAHVQHDVVAVEFILVYHIILPRLSWI